MDQHLPLRAFQLRSRPTYLACLDKLGAIVNHATLVEDHQLFGEIKRGNWSHLRFQALAELMLGSLLVVNGNVVGYTTAVSTCLYMAFTVCLPFLRVSSFSTSLID